MAHWVNVLTIPKIENQKGPISMFSAEDRPENANKGQLDFDGKQIEEKGDAPEEEDDKDDERIHERFDSSTINLNQDIDIEAIGETQFQQIYEMDGLTKQYLLD